MTAANVAASEAIDQFRAALEQRGIVPPQRIMADGRLHRCDAGGRNGKSDAAYVLHLDGMPAGGFQNWRDGLGWHDWRADIGRELTAEEHAAHRQSRSHLARSLVRSRSPLPSPQGCQILWASTVARQFGHPGSRCRSQIAQSPIC